MPPASQADVQFPTLVEIRNALPKEVFRAETATSLYYVARSCVLIAATAALLHYSLPFLPSSLQTVAWLAYWNVQGMLFWGVFVLGHDCGHGSFSRSPLVNQVFGNLLHSAILVPYESWKITHRHHHKNTGNMDKDEIYYPHREDTGMNYFKRLVIGSCGFAWALYLYGARHFSPSEPILSPHRRQVLVTLASWSAAFLLVVAAAVQWGVQAVLAYYLAPLFVFMCWLVITTFLHHQDDDAPWYGNEEWTYVKGNLSSIDRSYGWPVDNLIHNIGTHQIHHLFPKIPHYKLLDATAAFREAFPEHVRKTDEANMPAFWRNWWTYLHHALAPDNLQVFVYREAKAGAYAKQKKVA